MENSRRGAMAAELAASIVAAASTLHEQHTERKIVRVIEDWIPDFSYFVIEEEMWREIYKELVLVWYEKNEQWQPDPVPLSGLRPRPATAEDASSGPYKKVRVPLAKMLAEGWTVEREIKPAADVSYLVLARQAPRPRPGPPAGGV